MASVSMATPLTSTAHKNPTFKPFLNPMPLNLSKKASPFPKCSAKFEVEASLKEKMVTGLTAAALTASMVIPDVAEAAESGVPPSLKNFLLSIAAGGVVLTAIIGAVVGVSNFDPVKRA